MTKAHTLAQQRRTPLLDCLYPNTSSTTAETRGYPAFCTYTRQFRIFLFNLACFSLDKAVDGYRLDD